MFSERVLLAKFGNNCIKLALACGGLKAKRFYSFEKADAPIFAGDITDTVLMKDIIVTYLRKNKAGNCKVKIVLQHPLGIMRFMKLPKMKPGNLDKSIKSGIEELFPLSNKCFVYDYRTNIDDFGGVNVVAVRIPEDVSQAYASLFLEIGLKPVSLDTYANAASVYLERCQSGNFAAVFENPLSINILRFVSGRLVASRDIRYDDKACAGAGIRSYMELYPGVSERIFMFTDLKIADDVFLDMRAEVHKASVQFQAFYGLFGTWKD